MIVGVIGCGNISGVYFYNLVERYKNIEVFACADLNKNKTDEVKKLYPNIQVLSTEDLLAHPEIDIVLNLTTPQEHTAINLRALESGKHVYLEKPFALNMEEANKVLTLAKEKNLRVGCSPDTVLGAGIQTCRMLIEQGWIGKPTAAFAFMTCHGHESWHPNPEFYYLPGGGPILDMGPYYLSALIQMLGPISTVSAMSGRESNERLITESNRKGEIIPVEIDTHVSSQVRFNSGAIGTLVTSFDVWASQTPRIEIHGTHGSLSCPDPNTFDGEILYRKAFSQDWQIMSSELFENHGNCRGLGLSQMAEAIETNKQSIASGEMAAHVLEVILAMAKSNEQGKSEKIKTTIAHPPAMKPGFAAQAELESYIKVEG